MRAGSWSLLALVGLALACDDAPDPFSRVPAGAPALGVPLRPALGGVVPADPAERLRTAETEMVETESAVAESVESTGGEAADQSTRALVTEPTAELAAPGQPTAEPADPIALELALEPVDPGVQDDEPVDEGVDDDSEPPSRFPRPEAVRGLYVNAWAAGSATRMAVLTDLARRTEVNAFVIDIKDASGYLSHSSAIPLARESGATDEIRIKDLPGLLERMEREGIYPIARIVMVKDPLLVKHRPELAVQDTAGGVWVDSKGLIWLNPYSREVWEYHVEIAREVAALGFPEIQFDYVRFPDAPEDDLARAVFPGAQGRSKPTAIREGLAYAREGLEGLGVQLTADVFGVTTSARRDVGIGQVWEEMIDVVDVALPMVYPSHYWEGSFGFSDPNAHPYEIVRRAVSDAVKRSALVEGAGRVRPWLQDFTLGDPRYTSAEVRAQIQATYDAGVDEWILWNPSTRYTEGALQPSAGLWTEPLIRVGGRLVAASDRHAVLDSMAVAPDEAEAPVSPEVESNGADPVEADVEAAAPTEAESNSSPVGGGG